MTVLVAIALLAPLGLDSKVNLEIKDGLLYDVLERVSRESGYKITGPGFANNLKVTVFVKDMPARDLLRHLAELYHFETQAKEDKKEFVLILDQPTRMKLDDFIAADARYRIGLAENRLKALARLTDQPFESYEPVKPDAKIDSYDSWARGKIVQPAFYAAGKWYRANSNKTPAHLFYQVLNRVHSFWVGVPDAPRFRSPVPVSADFTIAFVDSGSAQILGTQIAIAVFESTGELRVEATKGETEENDPILERPFAYSHPPSALGSTRFAAELRSWETPVDRVPAVIRDVPARAAPKPKKEGYYRDRIGLGEKLEDFYRRTAVPVIATSFRIPALSQKLATATKAEDLLIDLAVKEETFLHWDKDCLLVRHPSYWALVCTEPNERLLRTAEEVAKKRSLGLFEYADIAASLDDRRTSMVPWMDRGPNSLFYDRLFNGRGFLVRFDYRPLEDAFLALAFVGHLHQGLRASYFQGDIQSWSAVDHSRGIVHTYYRTLDYAELMDRELTPEIIPAQVMASRASWPTISQVAHVAPFYRSTLSSLYFSRSEKYGKDPNVYSAPYDKGQTFWLERQGADTYWLNFGFLAHAYTSKYQMTIDEFVNPKNQDDDDDGGGR